MTTYEVKPPENLDDFGRWLNEWGDYDTREKGEGYRDGYYDAMRDAYDHFTRLNPDWHKKL